MELSLSKRGFLAGAKIDDVGRREADWVEIMENDFDPIVNDESESGPKTALLWAEMTEYLELILAS